MPNFLSTGHYLTLAILLVGGVTAPSTYAEGSDDGLNWFFTPYVWLSDTSLNATINDHTVLETELEFSDMVDKVETGFQGHLEGYGNHFGFFADLTYISAADDSTHEGISLDTEVDTAILELAAVYYLQGKGVDGLSVFAGLRQLSVDQKIQLQSADPAGPEASISEDKDWTDLMIGVRYGVPLTEKWQLGLRGDYSFGDTDGAVNLQALIGYRIAFWKISGAAMFGYRYFEFDLEEGAVKSQTSMSGPMIGMRFDF
jgi:hypothetical protein